LETIMNRHPIRTIVARLLPTVLILPLLVACGDTGSTVDPGPEAVHTTWITAVRENERETALALVAPMSGNETVFVDSALGRMQEILREQSNGTVATGALQSVDTLPLDDAGVGKVGISVWRFAAVTWCWETQLAPSEGRWAVTGWKQRLQCPEGVE
jgi:hypothetical protein